MFPSEFSMELSQTPKLTRCGVSKQLRCCQQACTPTRSSKQPWLQRQCGRRHAGPRHRSSWSHWPGGRPLGGPRAGLDPAIAAGENKFGLPSPMIDGGWAKRAADANKGYFLISLSPAQLEIERENGTWTSIGSSLSHHDNELYVEFIITSYTPEAVTS